MAVRADLSDGTKEGGEEVCVCGCVCWQWCQGMNQGDSLVQQQSKSARCTHQCNHAPATSPL